MKLLVIYLILVNVIGFLTFGLDKWKARSNRWRIRESTLFLLAALGGSLGCLIGMKIFHHKTKHKSFTIGIPAILILECLLLGYLFFQFSDGNTYTHNPKKVVEHELSLLKKNDTAQIEQYLSYQDIFPNESSDEPIPEDVEQLFSSFFDSFSYKILSVNTQKNTSEVTVSLKTLDGCQVAKAYSQQTLVKQIENSASPANVDFSLEDCYLLLASVLEENSFDTIKTKYTISLTQKDGVWIIDDHYGFENALTGNFATHVADIDLLSPGEIVAIHFDTLKSFDSEQINRYFALDSYFSGDAEYKRTISHALAGQILTYLDYEILSETISKDHSTASVTMQLTSYDSSSVLSNYQKQVMEYTNTAQALEDGISGRLNRANQILISCISENTASTTTEITLTLNNNGGSWVFETNDQISQALLGNISEAMTEVSQQLEN